VNWVYVTGATLEKPNHWEDIGTTVDRKIEALLAHRSQLGPEVGDWVRMMAKDAGGRAQKHGGQDYEYAEEFLKLFTGQLSSEGGQEMIRRERERARGAAG
jgi:LmbE family N-acetylglucosaminyl deacetylase